MFSSWILDQPPSAQADAATSSGLNSYVKEEAEGWLPESEKQRMVMDGLCMLQMLRRINQCTIRYHPHIIILSHHITSYHITPHHITSYPSGKIMMIGEWFNRAVYH